MNNNLANTPTLYHCRQTEQLAEKNWGRGWVALVAGQNGVPFHSFHEEEMGELLAKNIAKTKKDYSKDDIWFLENICSTEQSSVS